MQSYILFGLAIMPKLVFNSKNFSLIGIVKITISFDALRRSNIFLSCFGWCSWCLRFKFSLDIFCCPALGIVEDDFEKHNSPVDVHYTEDCYKA